MKMMALSIAGFGIFGCLPVFWTFPTAFLSGAAAAGGIALINSIGNLAGFAGPFAVGRIKDLTGSYTGGLLSLSAAGFVGGDHRARARPPGSCQLSDISIRLIRRPFKETCVCDAGSRR